MSRLAPAALLPPFAPTAGFAGDSIDAHVPPQSRGSFHVTAITSETRTSLSGLHAAPVPSLLKAANAAARFAAAWLPMRSRRIRRDGQTDALAVDEPCPESAAMSSQKSNLQRTPGGASRER
jgi:hypothetical protein